MRWTRFALLGALILAACSDDTLTNDTAELAPPLASAISDGANGGNPDFYFLPPLVSNPNPVGEFNGTLAPEVDVCLLVGPDCGDPATETVVAYFGPGEVPAGDGSYQVNWDTDDPTQNDIALLEEEDYRIRIRIGNEILGFMDVDPQDPNGTSPSDQREGFYTFRLGETIPVKFWLSRGVLCRSNELIVIECTESTIFDALGGTVALFDEGQPMGVTVPPDGLPDTDPVVTFRVERIQVPPGQRCIDTGAGELPVAIPTFDEFCLRITTIPETFTDPIPLDNPSIVTLCAELQDFEPLLADPNSTFNIQMLRQPEGDGPIQGLANVPSDLCGTPDPAPAEGTLARLLWPVTKHILPKPLYAIHRGRGGEVGTGEEVFEFSTYTWGLPARCLANSARTQTGNSGVAVGEAPSVVCLDDLDLPVQNVRLDAQVLSGNGTVTPLQGFTDENGTFTVDAWVLGDQGDNSVALSGFGIFAEDQDGVPDTFVPHEETWNLYVGSVTFDATAAGAPASIVPTEPTDRGEVEVGTTLPDPLVVTVLDNGANSVELIGVPNAQVTWTVTSGNGTLQTSPAGPQVTTATTSTNDGGVTQVIFTVGTLAGDNTITASVTSPLGTFTTSFTAIGTPGEPALIFVQSGNDQSGLVGDQLAEPLIVRVEDANNNPVWDPASVTWSVLAGGGTVNPTTSTTADDQSGLASTSLTLGNLPGTNTVRATVSTAAGPQSVDFNATASCRDGWGSATIDGVLGAEWACANVEPFMANLGGGEVTAELRWMNDADDLYLAVVIDGADKVNSLRFDFDNNANGVSEVGEDGVNFDPADGYTDEYLTEKCTNSSQAGCGNLDTANGGTSDGEGAFTNAAGVTIYELRKPLDSGDAAHDFTLTPGDAVGTFWTLRLGNGAKGNTQVPGFRVWFPLTTVGN